MHAAVEIQLADGRSDLIVAMDVENPLDNVPDFTRKREWIQPEWQVESDAEWLWLRKDAAGQISTVAVAKGTRVRMAGQELPIQGVDDFFEWVLPEI